MYEHYIPRDWEPGVEGMVMMVILRPNDNNTFDVVAFDGGFPRDESDFVFRMLRGGNMRLYRECSTGVADIVIEHHIALQDQIERVAEKDKSVNPHVLSALRKLYALSGSYTHKRMTMTDHDRRMIQFLRSCIRAYERKALDNLLYGQ